MSAIFGLHSDPPPLHPVLSTVPVRLRPTSVPPTWKFLTLQPAMSIMIASLAFALLALQWRNEPTVDPGRQDRSTSLWVKKPGRNP